MIFRQLFDQATWTYTYLLADPVSREAVIIDPVVEQVERDLQLIDELSLALVHTLDTHVHADHVTGSGLLRQATGAQSVVSAVANVGCVDRAVSTGDRLRFGACEIEVRSTPGHTNGCVTYVVVDGGQTMAFTGDALFIRGCGRTDFQQGDAEALYRSVHEQLFSLPEDTLIYPGHDYGGHSSSTVEEEKAHNPRLNTTVTQARFVAIMNDLVLADPKRMDVAVPANLACGRMESATHVAIRSVVPAAVDDLSGYRVVDVRQPGETLTDRMGRVKVVKLESAEVVPLGILRAAAKSWDRDQPLLLVCRSGNRSRVACERLLEMGFSDVTNLAGGMTAWTEHHSEEES